MKHIDTKICALKFSNSVTVSTKGKTTEYQPHGDPRLKVSRLTNVIRIGPYISVKVLNLDRQI